ncbi:LamG domain-containing protein [Bradyrhizobium sp. BRP56]|uniref:LamG domain-containing protein n=1 Tax=Bradyrhizobium sp. BRP56 TaxID=2793819 RepID=UPI001CD44584|nr:LamG domain-containing protein [Bradyrhizobium sp. BRP56]MCA1397908.1 LamG domain-containing protein [Bradyrhizobium sp. BRP56]
MTKPKLFGYSDKLSVKPGDLLQLYVNAEGADRAEARLVRLIHGDQHPSGPGFMEEEINCEANGTWRVEKQFTQLGSFLEVADPARRLALESSLTVFAFICPTRPQPGWRQSLISRWDNKEGCGFFLGISESGRLEFTVGQGAKIERLEASVPLQANTWYFVAATLDGSTGHASLFQDGVLNRYNSLLSRVALVEHHARASGRLQARQSNLPDTPFLIGGSRDWQNDRGQFVSQLYCGKIDRPGLFDRALSGEELDQIRSGQKPSSHGMVAYWDTAAGYTESGIGDIVTDTGPFRLHAEGRNRPVRGQTGWNWSGRNDCFRLAPQEYGGIEFHADALTDCNWKVTKAIKLPETLRSGAYAIRLRAGEGIGLSEEYIPFFVRPKTPKSAIAFLFPTASYIAYANERQSFEAPITQPVTGMPAVLSEIDIELAGRSDLSLSACDHWADGQGVCYSSYHRPIINLRPKYRSSSTNLAWQFPADLSVTAWLEHQNYEYEVLTDEDLEREGVSALEPYTCVISGTHPEYYSERMLDATEDYIASGGRYIYLGGNGFHWSVAFRTNEPWVMECRKFGPAWKTWDARPGEYYMATNGQKGGAWRAQGRPAQKVVGVGFISEGYGKSQFYRRMPDSYHRTVSWLTKGIDGEIIGDFGLAYGGAAGVGLDRCDPALGTPPHTKLIASSGGHTDSYLVNPEVIHYAFEGLSGSYDYRVRADMAYFTAPHHGAVFSAGSVAFGQALPVNNFDNNVSRLLANVVDAFVRPGALPGSWWISEEKQWR